MSNKNYAVIKDNVVLNVLVFDDPTSELIEFFKNGNNADDILEVNHLVSPQWTYDGVKFLPPQPYPSWIFNEELSDWEPPVQHPTSSKAPEEYFRYVWDEATLSWIEF